MFFIFSSEVNFSIKGWYLPLKLISSGISIFIRVIFSNLIKCLIFYIKFILYSNSFIYQCIWSGISMYLERLMHIHLFWIIHPFMFHFRPFYDLAIFYNDHNSIFDQEIYFTIVNVMFRAFTQSLLRIFCAHYKWKAVQWVGNEIVPNCHETVTTMQNNVVYRTKNMLHLL